MVFVCVKSLYGVCSVLVPTQFIQGFKLMCSKKCITSALLLFDLRAWF